MAGRGAGAGAALERLRRADRYTQAQALRELCGCVSAAGAGAAEALENTRLLLERAVSLLDIELSLKLYSVLAHALTASEAQYRLIVTCTEVYESAFRLLSKGLPDKMIVMFKLFTCLVYWETEYEGCRQRRLAQHAQNMLRSTGCLRLMAQFFIDKPIYTETWRTLCLCLAECCRSSELNQAHCSHLIPACVGKCASGAVRSGQAPVLSLLHALVESHVGNRDLFIRCRGIDLFNREVLSRCEGAQLLYAVTERCPQNARLAFQAQVPQTLTQLMKMRGDDSSVGQWCSIILFQITSGLKCLAEAGEVDSNDQNNIVQHEESGEEIDNIEHSQNNKNVADKSVDIYNNDQCDDTLNILGRDQARRMYNNISNAEIRAFNDKSGVSHNQEELSSFYYKPRVLNNARNLPKIHSMINENRKPLNAYNYRSKFNSTNVPFHSTCSGTSTSDIRTNRSVSTCVQTTKSSFLTEKARKYFNDLAIRPRDTKCCQTSFEDTTKEVSEMKSCHESVAFDPAITSTPRKVCNTKNNSNATKNIKNVSISGNTLRCNNKTQHRTIHKCKDRSKYNLRSNVSRLASTIIENPVKLSPSSLGSKLMHSFNASCASVMQGVKSYVLQGKENKGNSISTETTQNPIERKRSNSSFTEYFTGKYMERHRNSTAQGAHTSRKRTEVENTNAAACSFFGNDSDMSRDHDDRECKTCNDTVQLQKKLADNKYLKETVNKLRIGINTYGCNFKKIAHAFWPNEAFMTPAVLYNLYRKLILKK